MAPDLTGTVTAGRGFGSVRMARPEALDRMHELIGFPVVPGTLNVQLSGPLDRGLAFVHIAASEISPRWEAETGQAGYFVAPVLVAGRYRGVAFQADDPGYPADQVELLCEVHLRDALGLTDGDPIALSLLDPSDPAGETATGSGIPREPPASPTLGVWEASGGTHVLRFRL